MNRVISVLVLLPSVLFMVTGVRWLVAPAGVASDAGLTLERGLGLSSQLGDMASFFLTLGSCMLIALLSGQRVWYYPPIMLLLIAAVGRIVAWTLHDATLASELIALEIAVTVILLVASRRLAREA